MTYIPRAWTDGQKLYGSDLIDLENRLSINSDFGFINAKSPGNGLSPVPTDGVTNCSTSINAILSQYNQNFCLVFPAGDFLVGSTIQSAAGNANVKFLGSNTRFYVNGSISSMVSGSQGGQPTGNYEFEFEGITFDASHLTNICVNVGHRDRGWKFRRCVFKNMKTYGIYSGGMQYLDVNDCDFINEDGNPISYGIGLDQGGRGSRIRNSRFDWMRAPITCPTSNIPMHNPQYENNYVNGHWWQLPISVSNNGGTVTYTSTSIIDSSAPFTSIASGYVARARTVRVLTPYVSGNIALTYRSRITDGSADFSGVKPGWIVRTSDQWCVVDRVGTVSSANDTVFVGQWYELGSNWGKKSLGPSVASTPYTIYDIYHGRVTGITSTTLTIETAFSEISTGASTTPSNGALYELLIPHNDLKGIHIPPGVHNASVINNAVEGTWREAIFNFGSSTRIIGNVVRYTQDHGITSDNGTMVGSSAIINGNITQATGGAGIACYTDDSSVTGNVIDGANIGQYVITGSGLQIQGSRVVATGNKVTNNPTHGWELTSSIADYGIRLAGGASDCLISNNEVTGYPSGGVYCDSDAGTGNEIRYNKGGLIIHHTSAPASYITHSGTGSPEGIVKGLISSIYYRIDGGTSSTLYVKESGTGNTGWVAK